MSKAKKNTLKGNLLRYLIFGLAVGAILLTTLGAGEAGPLLSTARPEEVGMDAERLERLDGLMDEMMDTGRMPGAVLLVARHGNIVWREAYGMAEVEPTPRPMKVNTLFDLASLTKVVATSTAIMILLERGEFRLDQPVAYFIPNFAEKGKGDITLRQLLSHSSGLPAWRDFSKSCSDYDDVIAEICSLEPKYSPGVRYLYSDLNMILLAEVVRRVDGRSLDVFCKEEIFQPLGMNETTFNPSGGLALRAAATTRAEKRADLPDGTMMVGSVHDGNAALMGGVAGHAGLFSTADDLAVFAQSFLNDGVYGDERILSPLTIAEMTAEQFRVNSSVRRGLGWDLHSDEFCTSGDLVSESSFGHTGFTGTSIWIDPENDLFVILLAHRVHPDGRSSAFNEVRSRIHNVIAASVVE